MDLSEEHKTKDGRQEQHGSELCKEGGRECQQEDEALTVSAIAPCLAEVRDRRIARLRGRTRLPVNYQAGEASGNYSDPSVQVPFVPSRCQ